MGLPSTAQVHVGEEGEEPEEDEAEDGSGVPKTWTDFPGKDNEKVRIISTGL